MAQKKISELSDGEMRALFDEYREGCIEDYVAELMAGK